MRVQSIMFLGSIRLGLKADKIKYREWSLLGRLDDWSFFIWNNAENESKSNFPNIYLILSLLCRRLSHKCGSMGYPSFHTWLWLQHLSMGFDLGIQTKTLYSLLSWHISLEDQVKEFVRMLELLTYFTYLRIGHFLPSYLSSFLPSCTFPASTPKVESMRRKVDKLHLIASERWDETV